MGIKLTKKNFSVHEIELSVLRKVGDCKLDVVCDDAKEPVLFRIEPWEVDLKTAEAWNSSRGRGFNMEMYERMQATLLADPKLFRTHAPILVQVAEHVYVPMSGFRRSTLFKENDVECFYALKLTGHKEVQEAERAAAVVNVVHGDTDDEEGLMAYALKNHHLEAKFYKTIDEAAESVGVDRDKLQTFSYRKTIFKRLGWTKKDKEMWALLGKSKVDALHTLRNMSQDPKDLFKEVADLTVKYCVTQAHLKTVYRMFNKQGATQRQAVGWLKKLCTGKLEAGDQPLKLRQPVKVANGSRGGVVPPPRTKSWWEKYREVKKRERALLEKVLPGVTSGDTSCADLGIEKLKDATAAIKMLKACYRDEREVAKLIQVLEKNLKQQG